MERAVGKTEDFPADAGKPSLPGAKIRWEIPTTLSGKRSRTTSSSRHLVLSQGHGAEAPHHPRMFNAATGSELDILRGRPA
jgi:hypothetical protein